MYTEKNRPHKVCPVCGRIHKSSVREVVVGSGSVARLPEFLQPGGRVFILADKNTYAAAGNKVREALSSRRIAASEYIFDNEALEPDEKAVGSAAMHFDKSCDAVIGIGSGVINDISKIISAVSNKQYIIVASAPSMDGYASATSSMSLDGLKVSVPSKAADVIIGDTDILKTAPDRMLRAGLGDMLAKYISICEWRIANLLVDEYYCGSVASVVRASLKKCVDNADGLLKRDDAAVEAVFDGLVTCGMAMEYAGLSRPASGVEHYISHIWDMRGLAKGTPVDLHGIQCAIGTLYAAKIYESVKKTVPDRKKAVDFVNSFDKEQWNRTLYDFVGEGAEAMIALEEKEQKYSPEKHGERLNRIIANWDSILNIIDEEVPSPAAIEKILDTIHAPKTCDEIGIDKSVMPLTFQASKDIRDKYVLSRLCWDLGIIDEMSSTL